MEIIRTSTLLSIAFFISSSSAKGCGMRRSLSRVVGGRDTGGYHYPWFALLVLKQNEDYPVCAGSLISNRHVLSAAHCFTIKPSAPKEELFTVLMGVYDRCNRKEPDRQAFDVSRVDLHEEYVPGEKFHDIALITLAKTADYTFICLPSEVRDVSEPAILIGFGVTKEGGRKAPCHMMEARVTKYSKRDCKATELPEEDIAEPTVICAGKIRGGIDSCQGDSGGPLQITTNDGKLVLSGIVSYGYGCANRGLPGLYTNVGSYLGWIRSKTSVKGERNGSQFASGERQGFPGSPANIPTQNVRFPSDSNPTTVIDSRKSVRNASASTVNFPKNR